MKNWKNRTLVATIAFLGVIVCFTACPPDGNGNTTHTHSYGNWTTKTEATCTTAKVEKRNCSCGEEETQNIGSPLGHLWGEWEEHIEATVDTEGEERRYCHREGCDAFELQATERHVHTYCIWTTKTPATCTEKEEQIRTCTHTNCAHHETKYVGEPLGHDWNDWTETTPATCTIDGIKTRTCKRCGVTDPNTQTGILALGHNFQFTSNTPVSCEVDGFDLYACNRCTETENRNIVTALGHNYLNWTEPSCTVAGNSSRICTRTGCGHEDTRTTGYVALGHNWQWIETSDGIETKTCSVCNETDGIQLSLNIGDTGPRGGKIFYRSETGFSMTDTNEICHYLEAAPADMDSKLAWASSLSYEWTMIEGTASQIGAGRKNTILILAIDTLAPAAMACFEYGNSNDWFLPSIDELCELYKYRVSSGLLGPSYWASTQGTSINYAGISQFDNGGQPGFVPKDMNLFVRAVRAF